MFLIGFLLSLFVGVFVRFLFNRWPGQTVPPLLIGGMFLFLLSESCSPYTTEFTLCTYVLMALLGLWLGKFFLAKMSEPVPVIAEETKKLHEELIEKNRF